MRKVLLIITHVLFLVQVNGQNNFKDFLASMKDTIVEKHIIDIDNDGILDTAFFRFPANYEHPEFGYSDPGVFIILDLRLTHAEDILIKELFDTLNQKPFDGFKNEINSNCAFLSDFKTQNRYLFMTGPSFGCCLEKTYIFKINKEMIDLISKSSLNLIDVRDFNNDGKIEVIGYDKKGESWGGYQTDFEFYQLIFPTVFKITDTLVMDKNLTYKYNLDLKEKYGKFLSFTRPVVVKNMIDKSEKLVEFKDIKGIYERKYDIASRTKIKESALEKYSKIELRLMRNEIFAAHGYIFKSADLREYFEKAKWYKPQFTDVTDKLTEIEKYNIKLILETENKN